MDYYTYKLPCEDFIVTSSNGVPAHFTCTGTSDGIEVRIAHGYAGAFGLGERYDALNYLGKTAVNAVEEKFCRQGDKTYCPMPFFWTDSGLGVYAETARVTRFEFGRGSITLHLPEGCALHVFSGSPEEIVAAYMRLTGEPVLPPDWVFGPWISANHWDSREKLERDWDEAVRRGLCVKNADGTPYRIPEGHWFAGSLVPDFTNPETVESWFSRREYLTGLGVDGFKTDGGEFILSDGARFFDGTDGAEGRNLYPQMYTGAYTEHLKPGQALFSRAGYVGAHTTPILWAGDQVSTFDELRSQLNAGLSASASGVIFWGFDIGGFAGELPSPELYLRATQLACFAPIMQWHSEPDGGQFKLLQPGMEGNNERSPWNIERAFGLTGYTERVRRWHLLRMELLPYIRAEAAKCVESCRPLMRPMAYAFPGDARCVGIDDEYMFGDALLVAPVLSEGVSEREVYLPGGEWRDFYTGERLPGGQTLRCECADAIPVFIRQGYSVMGG